MGAERASLQKSCHRIARQTEKTTRNGATHATPEAQPRHEGGEGEEMYDDCEEEADAEAKERESRSRNRRSDVKRKRVAEEDEKDEGRTERKIGIRKQKGEETQQLEAAA